MVIQISCRLHNAKESFDTLGILNSRADKATLRLYSPARMPITPLRTLVRMPTRPRCRSKCDGDRRFVRGSCTIACPTVSSDDMSLVTLTQHSGRMARRGVAC